MADLRAEIEQLKEDLGERANDILDKAATFARSRPHLAVGAALGVGWVLGNGLHPRLAMGATRMVYKALVGSAFAGGGLMQTLGVEQEDAREDARAASRAAAPSGARRAAPEGKTGSVPEGKSGQRKSPSAGE